MTSSIDKLGRIVIPKAIRDEAGWQSGTPLELRYRFGVLEIAAVSPEGDDARFEKRGTVWVAIPPQGAPPLDLKAVEGVLEGVAESGIRDLAKGASGQ
ncbi:MAG: AbrB/MazE/SpoVT family DNA-binding domain-containing protein [Bryobacteraceae bacterium]